MVALIVVSLQLGFEALLYSQIAVAVIELGFNTWFTRKLIGLSLFTQLMYLWPVVLSSAVMALGVWFVIQWITIPWLQLLTGAVSGVLIYMVLIYLTNAGQVRLHMHETIHRLTSRK